MKLNVQSHYNIIQFKFHVHLWSLRSSWLSNYKAISPKAWRQLCNSPRHAFQIFPVILKNPSPVPLPEQLRSCSFSPTWPTASATCQALPHQGIDCALQIQMSSYPWHDPTARQTCRAFRIFCGYLNHSMHMALEETVHNSAVTTQCEIPSAWISVGNLKVQSCRVRAVWVTPFGL